MPGFVSARRYVAADSARPHYFTLYELDSLEALATPAYVDVVDNPTTWSRAMRPHFSNVTRLACNTIEARGNGCAAALTTVTLAASTTERSTHESGARFALDPRIELSGVTAIRIGSVDHGVRTHPAFADRPASPASHRVTHLMLIEGLWVSGTASAAPTIARAVALALGDAEIGAIQTFRWAFGFTRRELADTDGSRLPPRDDLRLLAKGQ